MSKMKTHYAGGDKVQVRKNGFHHKLIEKAEPSIESTTSLIYRVPSLDYILGTARLSVVYHRFMTSDGKECVK